MNADAATLTPDPQPDAPHPGLALLCSHVVTALGFLESLLCRRTEEYAALEPPVAARRLKSDIIQLTRLASVYKTIHEAQELNPGPAPLPEPRRFLPARLAAVLDRAEHAFEGLMRLWDNRRRPPTEAQFDLAFLDLTRIVGIRKTALDLAALAPADPAGFPGWDADGHRDPFNDPDPPVLPAGVPLTPERQDALTATLAQVSPFANLPLMPAEPRPGANDDPAAQAAASENAPEPAQPSAHLSNPKSEIPNPSHPSHSSGPSGASSNPKSEIPNSPPASPSPVPTCPSLSAISRFRLGLAERHGPALIFLRPLHKNPVIFRFNVYVEKFIFDFDPSLAEDPEPAEPDLFPDEPDPYLDPGYDDPDPPPLPAT